MLGFDISERTVFALDEEGAENLEPARRWAAFLINHREAIAAMDFFTVPTLTFGVFYCYFSSRTTGAGSCSATSQNIRPRSGSFSSCAKHFRMTRRLAI